MKTQAINSWLVKAEGTFWGEYFEMNMDCLRANALDGFGG